ncbi:MAG: radical SAM family heme chaperone HemW [bacterium]|nr:radical SAM family heme chaperone HemW [bacterium]
MNDVSIYIHIPFCKSICSYCDFCKLLYNEKWVDLYLDSLEKEIKSYNISSKVKTLYIGGGTPSSLSEKCLEKLFTIINKFNFIKNYEFTFECNINDINSNLLNILKKGKVNRLSIGIESFNKDNLILLNRTCDYEDVKNKINLCKKFGFNNINVDLIYAVPNENEKILLNDLNLLTSLDITHISTYSLMIEENTVLYINNIKPIKEKLDYKMYKIICKFLKEKGFNHYEISNFAKKGYESEHNLVYWNNEYYYGFGLGASGYISNIRYNNTRNLNDYLKGIYLLNKEIITNEDNFKYGLILGLRKINGINVNNFNEKYHTNILENEKVKKLIKLNELIYENDFIFINEKYIYVQNEILIKLI